MPLARIGRYHILKWLGGGRFGDVYLALDSLSQREVALKVIRIRDDPASYLKEVRSLAKLDHPAILRFYTVDILEGRLVIVTEAVGGETVRKLLSKGRMRKDQALSLAQQLLEAVDHAHEQGVIHRDIKPENLMVTGEGRLKVLDFGLSRIAQEDVSLTLGGTPSYMAPEVWKGSFSPASDQWSAAVVIMEMLTGVNPFGGDALETVREKILKGVKREGPLSFLNDDLARTLTRALEREPSQRYPTCGAFLQDLIPSEGSSLPVTLAPSEERTGGFPPLTQEQRDAVEDPSKVVLVIGGPGTGKTTTLLARALFLMREGVPPERMALLTFSLESWKAMERKIEEVIDGKYRGMWLGNFHHLAFRIVSRFSHLLGLPQNPAVLPLSHQERLAQKAALQVGGDKGAPHLLQAFLESRKKGKSWEGIIRGAQGRWKEMLIGFHDAYIALSKEKGTLGYADLVHYAAQLLNHEEVASFYQDRLDHLLVDEIQDLDAQQIAMVETLSRKGRLFVVGDDDQSIYQWRGALPGYMRELQGKDASCRRLTRSFRLPPEFRDGALALISQNQERLSKLYWTSREGGEARLVIQPLKTPQEEREYVADMIEILRIKEGIGYSHCAVLCRTHARERYLEGVLRKRNIPFYKGGDVRGFSEEIQLLVTLLRCLAKGNTPTWRKKVMDEASRLLAFKDDLWAGEEVGRLLDNLEGKVGPSEALTMALETLGRIMAHKEDPLQMERGESMVRLLKIAREFEGSAKSPTIPNFLRYLRFLEDSGLAEGERGVKVLSIHGAKGLEFPVVFIPGLVEGESPLSRALGVREEMEEERRLFYTAMTRSTHLLFLTYYHYSSPRSQYPERPSPFLKEILGM